MVQIDTSVASGIKKIAEQVAAISSFHGYQDTAYYLPISYAISGSGIDSQQAAEQVFAAAHQSPLIGAEILLASRGVREGPPYTGFIEDAVIRKLGYTLVDGSILGLALVVGNAASADYAAAICRELQEKLMLTFLSGGVITSLTDAGVRVGLDLRLVPLGKDSLAAVHFADILARVAMMFGGVVAGDAHRLVAYASERAKAFVIAFPGMTDEEVAFIDALRVLGIPILHMGGYEGHDWVQAGPTDIVRIGMEMRGIRVQVTSIPIPMACSPAFEGKAIRKEEMYAEFGGTRSPAFELLRVRDSSEVTDGKVIIIGPEIDTIPKKSAAPLGIIVEVAGKAMKKEFEPVLERRIHNFINYGEGSWHSAQRDQIWVRVSEDAVSQGLRITDLGKLLAAKFRMDFPTLLDAVQVTMITDREQVLILQKEAESIYSERDERIAGMKDEDVTLYYSCTLCQTFAPNHVCVLTPERPALCGALTWLDGKTAYEMSPSGANQPIEKGTLINDEAGEYEGVNRFVRQASHGEIERCVLYSIMDAPMTCCGCFEAVAMILPETNGIMIVSREYKGDTPSGMTFSTLAGTIGGGAQTPGFIGISKGYLLSDRFIQAEGGLSRIVWMPLVVKEELETRLRAKMESAGLSGLYEKIADETVATDIEGLLTFLTSVDHPALSMAPLL
ncbi:MAG: CO dehydrogenase/CO-methylating acetyl-CoA synthase complex subunit beta [Methanospirillum sp.]|uniref:acetyl-CoA decarbonylase/synthase complex subunit alpha/beta n=1 Tax=Methanospirillum sp. TaxID=45200 RepID=UPI00236F9468|nr:acetyl-CoA decarbonylase/synthase complex subunit alpha/beta [Methanospirillum sp.]MDD1727860.1 CO dehydrogenase/CO-methylating acetyl-CoA synthase complex subunit beta [Methanospirillum sp.]